MPNPSGCVEIPLNLFGGINTELGVTDLPPGLSPSCSDVAFLPGQVFTRPSLQRLDALGTTAQVVYASSYIRPDGAVVQLRFTSDGKMYADGVQVGTTKAGNRFQTCNAFGKTMLAISDGLHGTDVPLQYTEQGWLDRVSQDGPGAPPSVTNFPLPQVALTTGSAGSPVTIASATPADPEEVQVGGGDPDFTGGYTPPQFETYYTSLVVVCAAPHGLAVGQVVVIGGNALYNMASAVVEQVLDAVTFKVSFFGQNAAAGAGGTVTPQTPLLSRTGNIVVANTSAAHGLRTGYRVRINGLPQQAIGGAVSSIIIDNVNSPGVATVTTSLPHGLSPETPVYISGVQAVVVGGSITNLVINAGITTITTATPHGLQPGAQILVTAAGGPQMPFTVSNVISATQFSYVENKGDTTYSSGTVYLAWPNADSTVTGGNVFNVASVPTSTTFTIPISYSSGTWTTGVLTFAWDGDFYVTSVPSATSLEYRQVGPDAVLGTGAGTVTPLAQIAPGNRQCVVMFLTRTGYLTTPSKPISFTSSGGQYLRISGIPIGPANVVARWLAFTGADGATFFTLPVPAQANGQAVSSATVINDNTTTSVLLDFSDQSLFAAMAIDIPGNNLFRQVVLGPCLGFYAYGSRLLAWGERNKVQNLYNMGFEGGYLASAPTVPLFWQVSGTGVALTSAGVDYGMGVKFTDGTTTLSQNAAQDGSGVAVLQPNTLYTFRCWAAGTVRAQLVSPSAGTLATATVVGTGMAAEAVFNAATPLSLPPDTQLVVSSPGASSGTPVLVDELMLYPTKDPYLSYARVSYEDNPEAFDGVTGLLGPANDPRPVMGILERRDVLNILTYGPDGSLYETEQTASSEPSGWNVRHVAAKCGLTSVWGIAQFEDWFCWTSDTGVRIFDGGTVEKMSQEVQPFWDSINPAAKQFTVLANDPYTRRMYLLCATGNSTVTSSTYVMDYRELNTPSALENAGTLRVSMQGKVITTDLTRKWTPWSTTLNFCGMLTQAGGGAVMGFCGGTESLATALHSAVYALAEGELSGIDADYGPFWDTSFYNTYFFLAPEEAQQRQLGAHRLLHDFLTMNVSGVGKVQVTPHLNAIGNTGAPTRAVPYPGNGDVEFGLRSQAERVSYRISCEPAATGGPAGFRLSSFVLAVRTHPFSPIKGWNRA